MHGILQMFSNGQIEVSSFLVVLTPVLSCDSAVQGESGEKGAPGIHGRKGNKVSMRVCVLKSLSLCTSSVSLLRFLWFVYFLGE